jgi:hypothetical protein
LSVYEDYEEVPEVQIRVEIAGKKTEGVSELQKAVALELKHCNGCDCDLPFDAFSFDNSRKDGLNIRCRNCVKRRWQDKNKTTPCEDCGKPSMNGTCAACYRFQAFVDNAEDEILLIIPRLLWHSRIAQNKAERAAIAQRRKQRALIREIASQEHLPSYERLRLLLEKVSSGNKRNRKTKA